MKISKSRFHHQAFSLVELLMTISVLGVMAAMSMTAFGSISETAKDHRDMRNAQEIASLAAMARAAGVDFVVAGDEAASVQKLVIGQAPASGAFKGRVFKLPPISGYAVAGALKYLEIKDQELCYHQKPEQ